MLNTRAETPLLSTHLGCKSPRKLRFFGGGRWGGRMIYQIPAETGFEMRRIAHRKTPGAGPTGRRVRRFLMGCSGLPASVCFAIGASFTRPPAHEANRPDRRASGYRVCPCRRCRTAVRQLFLLPSPSRQNYYFLVAPPKPFYIGESHMS